MAVTRYDVIAIHKAVFDIWRHDDVTKSSMTQYGTVVIHNALQYLRLRSHWLCYDPIQVRFTGRRVNISQYPWICYDTRGYMFRFMRQWFNIWQSPWICYCTVRFRFVWQQYLLFDICQNPWICHDSMWFWFILRLTSDQLCSESGVNLLLISEGDVEQDRIWVSELVADRLASSSLSF